MFQLSGFYYMIIYEQPFGLGVFASNLVRLGAWC